MSVESDFEDVVTLCNFYKEGDWSFYVDLENLHVVMGDYAIDPVWENGHLVGYLVVDPEGVTQVVDDLDSYFQDVLDWEVMS